MTTTLTLEPGAKAARRRRGIEPFLQQLEAACAAGFPTSLRCADADPDAPTVPLDPWAVAWIQSCTLEPGGPADLSELLKQCLAFLVKSATDAARLRREPPRAGTDFYAVQAELMLDSAVGMALLRETQTAVTALVGSGNLDHARMLAKLQNRLRGTVRELKQSLAESNRGRDDELVEQFTDHAAPESAPLPTGPVDTGEERSAAARRPQKQVVKPVQAPQRPRSRRRTEILLGLVLLAGGALVATRAVPAMPVSSVTVVSRADFNASAPIRQIMAPPPSAYVVVEDAAWEAYDEGQRLRLVNAMGGVLAANGYWGLLVRTPDGVSVATWVEGRGSLLLQDATPPERREDASHERFDRFVTGAAPRAVRGPQ